MPETFVALKTMKVGVSPTETRTALPGTEVPEAADWPDNARRHLVDTGFLMMVPDLENIRGRAVAESELRRVQDEAIDRARRESYEREEEENARVAKIREEEAAEEEELAARRARGEEGSDEGATLLGVEDSPEDSVREQERRLAKIREEERKEEERIHNEAIRRARKEDDERREAINRGETYEDPNRPLAPTEVDPEAEADHAAHVAEIRDEEAEEAERLKGERSGKPTKAVREEIETAAQLAAGLEFREEGSERPPAPTPAADEGVKKGSKKKGSKKAAQAPGPSVGSSEVTAGEGSAGAE